MVKKKQIEFIKPDLTFNSLSIQEKNAKMANLLVQKAVGFANDSMFTRLCLQYPADQIAAAILYMSAQGNKMRPIQGCHWLDIFVNLDMDSLISIVKQIIELIADKKKNDLDRSIFASIEADLKILKKATGSSGNSSSGGKGEERDAKKRRT